ncbi:adhesin, partial [Cryobacterium sp. TMT1-2-2]|uniref:Ig-like domain-containing protein n=1 Tax=Cryobacterium sp. TMT1-2-2 TaxID=1259233 RepID=UPI00106B0386
DGTPTISGTTDAPVGTTVTVVVAGQTLTARVIADGSWSVIAAALVEGGHTVTVSVTDVAGNTGTVTQRLTLDVTAPSLVITGGSMLTTADGTPTISGTTDAPVGTTVTVVVAGQTLTATVVSGGTWSVTAATLVGGEHTVTVSITDLAGNSGSATQALTHDAEAPTVVFAGGATQTTSDRTPTIWGTTNAANDSVVTLDINGTTVSSTVTAGAWSVLADGLGADGTYPVVVTIAVGGRVGTGSQTITLDTTAPTLVITGGAALTTADSTPTISGATDAPVGTSVTVTVTDTMAVTGQTLTSTVVAGGTWSVIAAALVEGGHTVTVSVTDLAGNTGTAIQTIRVDTTKPSLAIIAGSTLINDSTPTISGTTDAANGTVVTVTVADQTLSATVFDGAWSVTAGALSDGNHLVSAVVTDPAGNSQTATQAYSVDTVAPIVSISGGSALTNADTTPTISGTSNAPVGTAVSVSVGTQTLAATVIAGGTWSVAAGALVEGDHTITASITDAAGNTGVALQVYTVVAAPDVTVIGGAAAASNDPAPTFVGTSTAAAGSAVTVTIDGQVLRTTVTAAGTWSVESAEISADGNFTVDVTVVDRVTNLPATSTQVFTIDTTAPAVAVTVAPAGRTRDTTPTLSGTTDAPVGATVSVTVAGQVLSATVQVGGVWTVEPGALADGNVDVVVTAEDTYGNARSASHSFVVATTPPQNTTLEQTVEEGALQSLAVTGADFDPGESVQVWIHSTPVLLSTVTADANGNIVTSVIVPEATAAGLHHIVMIGVTSSTAQLASETITVINSGTKNASVAAVAPVMTELARSGFEAPGIGGAAFLLLLAGVLLLILRRDIRKNSPPHQSVRTPE